MITKKTMENVKEETGRFLKAYFTLKLKLDSGDVSWIQLRITGCKESAALKRASLDLSRALTELRHVPRR